MAIAAMVAVAARIATGPHAIDDAYITFRYARNLADGMGLVYNAGEWVLGTTAPLWAIVLSGGYRLGFTDLPWLATVVSALCDAASAAVLVRLGVAMGWKPWAAALVGVAWALNPMSIAFATGGMETSLFVLVALAVLSVAATRKHLVIAGMVAGLATFVRPEGALLAGSVVAWTWLAERRFAEAAVSSTRPAAWQATARVALAAAAPMAAGGFALFLRYGSPLPNSVAAKQVAYQPAWPFENAVTLLLQAGLPGWSTYVLTAVPGVVGLVLAALGLIALTDLARRGVPSLARKGAAWQPFVAFGALYVTFYVFVGLRGVRLFPWYLVPIEPFYLLGASAGLAHVGFRRGAWLAGLLVLWQLPAINWSQPLLPAGEDFAREDLYLQVGRGLAESLPPTATLAAPEIGALGYASNLRVLDTVGLVSPAAIPYYPLPHDQLVTDNAIPAQLILDKQPDIVVTLDAFAQRSLLADAAFQSEYEVEHAYPASVWGSQELLVFRRAGTLAQQR